ncbi:mechanosensitive ion channel domain-containing protein [Aurantimonas endophytica]|uniref:Small-conductance mechanosensitive channel n=1 Tax=Aurantimonas endophytica TaxID=1522175 RepID=A0A7W6MPM1_9HYPH|nr:small-conductance mechanosensitive channel [Aurantimonas endophytica]
MTVLTRIMQGGCRWAVLLVSLWVFAGTTAAAAQPATTAAPPPAATVATEPPKVDQLLKLLDDPEVRSWLETRAAPAAVPQDDSIATVIGEWEALYRVRLADLIAAVPRIPAEFERAAAIVASDVNAGNPGRGIAILALLLGFGYAAERIVARLVRSRASPAGGASRDPHMQPTGIVPQFVPLAVFAAASTGLFLALHWPPLLRKMVLTYLVAVVLIRVVIVAARVLLAPDLDQGSGQSPTVRRSPRILPVSSASAGFWQRRLILGAGYGLLVWATLSIMPALGFTTDVVRLAALASGLGLLGIAIESVWRRPDADPHGTVSRNWLLTLYLVGLWLLWAVGMFGAMWIGIYALVLPRLIAHAGRAAQTVAARRGEATLSQALTNVLIVRGIRALVIALAVGWLASVWRFSPIMSAPNDVLQRLAIGLLHGIIILLVADLLWNLAKVFIARKLDAAANEDDDDPEATVHRARVRTLLPIFRNTLATFILVVAILTILSGMGIAIGPLVAGAGIFGVAIGLGSQTIVKDFLGGVFYMLDDAFRVGEYIQSGNYKGKVESFSLRSVRLRHHRGPVYTVPFGDLGAIQNMSRDWVIDKMVINVTYDSDIDLARKIIKKIGLELAEDPEFAPSIIEPLKMQGVDSFGDYAVVLRMKMMTKPGEQFVIKRKALLMIKKAFAENGIKIAVSTVQVSGGSEDENAAAAGEVVRRRNAAAEPAANTA